MLAGEGGLLVSRGETDVWRTCADAAAVARALDERCAAEGPLKCELPAAWGLKDGEVRVVEEVVETKAAAPKRKAAAKPAPEPDAAPPAKKATTTKRSRRRAGRLVAGWVEAS